MKDTALQLESRFSLSPNSLGYCGKKSATDKFKICISEGMCNGVKEELKNFIVLYPYLKTLSKITGEPFSSYSVIEGYWLGNDELKKANLKYYNLLLKNFNKQGVPDFFVEELRAKKLKEFIPNHLFHVLFIGVGKASGAVPFNISTINDCMIRWGIVKEVSKKQAVVILNSLEIKGENGFELIKIKETVPYNSKFTSDLKAGDTVAVHWNMIVKILDTEEINKLLFWTKKVLRIFS
jgi:hypothetical protein